MSKARRPRAALARSRERSQGPSAAPAAEGTRSARPTPSRIEGIDTLRGIAIVAMIAYHFTFDLRFFGVIRADFEGDPFWLGHARPSCRRS